MEIFKFFNEFTILYYENTFTDLGKQNFNVVKKRKKLNKIAFSLLFLLT